jgi:ribonuclease HII
MVIEKCYQQLKTKPEYLLVDFIKVAVPCVSKSIVKGDQKSISIAAASILAKVARDKYMENISTSFPCYHFNKHKGYGSKIHSDAIAKNYISYNFHRLSYAPIKNAVAQNNAHSSDDDSNAAIFL